MVKLNSFIFVVFIFLSFLCFSSDINEEELSSWDNHMEMINSLNSGGWGDHILMKETSSVRIGTFNYSEDKVVDVFYPPEMDFNEQRPVLILVGLSDTAIKRDYGVPYRYLGQALGWGQCAAEKGLVVLAHETGSSPKSDLVTLVEWVRENGKKYGLDGDRIGLWSCSDACDIAIKALRPDNNGFSRPSATFAVFYYGNLTAYSGLDVNVPMLIATAESDSWVDLSRIEKFISKMNEQGSSITYLHNKTGHHGFEISEDTPETRYIIDETLTFMIENSF